MRIKKLKRKDGGRGDRGPNDEEKGRKNYLPRVTQGTDTASRAGKRWFKSKWAEPEPDQRKTGNGKKEKKEKWESTSVLASSREKKAWGGKTQSIAAGVEVRKCHKGRKNGKTKNKHSENADLKRHWEGERLGGEKEG